MNVDVADTLAKSSSFYPRATRHFDNFLINNSEDMCSTMKVEVLAIICRVNQYFVWGIQYLVQNRLLLYSFYRWWVVLSKTELFPLIGQLGSLLTTNVYKRIMMNDVNIKVIDIPVQSREPIL